MKLRSVKYLTGEGVKSIWANRLMSIASIGVLIACMTLIGLAVLLTSNVNQAMNNLETENVIMVYFNDRNSVLYGDSETLSSALAAANSSGDASGTASTASGSTSSTASTTASSTASTAATTDRYQIPESAYLIHNEDEAKAVCEEIRKLDNIHNVEFISSAQGLQNAKETVSDGGLTTLLDEDNPISHGAKVTLTDLSRFDETVASIRSVKGVDKVYTVRNLAQTITTIKNVVGNAGVWIIAILLIIALVIVSNTIRVTMYNRKLEIGIMKAVGATNAFIRFPFLIEGVTLGLISALLSEGVVYFCYRIAAEGLKSQFGGGMIRFSAMAWQLLGIFAVIGVLAGTVGSLIMISKYLRKEGSEFRAI